MSLVLSSWAKLIIETLDYWIKVAGRVEHWKLLRKTLYLLLNCLAPDFGHDWITVSSSSEILPKGEPARLIERNDRNCEVVDL